MRPHPSQSISYQNLKDEDGSVHPSVKQERSGGIYRSAPTAHPIHTSNTSTLKEVSSRPERIEVKWRDLPFLDPQ